MTANERIPAKVISANGEVYDGDTRTSIIVITMTGEDFSKMTAALHVLADFPDAGIRNDLMPLLTDLLGFLEH